MFSVTSPEKHRLLIALKLTFAFQANYIFTFTFTFMHLADAFIQSDLSFQAIHFFLSVSIIRFISSAIVKLVQHVIIIGV